MIYHACFTGVVFFMHIQIPILKLTIPIDRMAECSSVVDDVHFPSTVVPRPVTTVPPSVSPRRRPLETGFDCEFVEKPREVQPDCPICLHILREPYQATCCGNIFCRTCIERVKECIKPCPMCNQEKFEIFHDKRLQHTLYDFQVVCPHKLDGCEWKGELRELEKHLNSNPVPEKQLDGCMYEAVACVYCKADYFRKDIQFHQGSKCGKRPYSCEYCSAYQSTCNDVIDNHWPVCPSRPVPCPNDCGVYPERKNLKSHLVNECTKRVVECPFTYAGCSATFHPTELHSHLENNTSMHLSLVASFSQKMIHVTTELSQKVSDLEMQIQKLSLASSSIIAQGGTSQTIQFTTELHKADACSTEVQSMSKEFRMLSDARDQILKRQSNKIEELEQQNKLLQHQVDSLLHQPGAENVGCVQELRSHLYIVPVVYTMPDYSTRLSQSLASFIFKPHPFYTFPQGYKMQLCVNAYGDGPGKGTHISVFLILMKGDFDDNLKWPFRGSVTIQILSQNGDSQHYTDCITYRDGVSDQVAGRVMDERRSAKPWGKVKFMSHADISSTFVRNDSVKICISKVDI